MSRGTNVLIFFCSQSFGKSMLKILNMMWRLQKYVFFFSRFGAVTHISLHFQGKFFFSAHICAYFAHILRIFCAYVAHICTYFAHILRIFVHILRIFCAYFFTKGGGLALPLFFNFCYGMRFSFCISRNRPPLPPMHPPPTTTLRHP